MNPYLNIVREYARLDAEARLLPLGGFPRIPRPECGASAPRVMIFSPHPDDEVIIGGLALRLFREAGWRVVNVAVTQGSNVGRQGERFAELKACCECIGFDLVATAPAGLVRVAPQTRQEDPAHWQSCVAVIAGLLHRYQPRAILFPHELDWNSTHVGTHWLVMDALRGLPGRFECYTIETEFWGQNPSPNLMVELTAQHLADLMTALTFHVGELKRNPYHVRLPAWMMDNVRRGAELVGGQGGAAPEFAFATLYQLRRWADGRLQQVYPGGRTLLASESADSVFSSGDAAGRS